MSDGVKKDDSCVCVRTVHNEDILICKLRVIQDLSFK